MFNFKKLFFTLILSTTFTGFIVAQPPPPPAASKENNNARQIVQQASLRNLSANEKFSSADGRFTISLPLDISGFTALTPQNTQSNASGSLYQWRIKEGIILVSYSDFLDENFNAKTEQDYVDYFGGATKSALTSTNAKLINSSNIKLGNYRGIKLNLEFPDGSKGTHRNFIVNKRQYSLTAKFDEDVPDAEKLINKAFDTLTLISQTAIEEELRRKVEESTPPSLPQEPVAKKEKTDAEDENLRGKVKTVTEESEDLSGTWSVQGRHFDSIEDYNEKGNRLKQLLFDSKAIPFQITVYGYIDGARVSSSKIITYENSPPPLMAISKPNNKEVAKSDPRYSYKFEYKYIDGKLAETRWIMNNNSLWIRYVNNYKGNQVEELVYDKEGKLNQKYLTVLDDNGNEVERTNFNVLGIQRDGDSKYSIKYDSFDEKGNWTKKTTSKLVMENGKQIYKPINIKYRTITYYP